MATKQWFKHGKWPRFFVGLHYYTIVSFILLLITGIALFLPAIHTVLIPYLRFIYAVHITLGLIFAASLLMPFIKRLPYGKKISLFDWLMPTVLGTAIVLTGILLFGVDVFPDAWRGPAFTWHGYFSILLSVWIVAHAFYKAIGSRFPTSRTAKIDPSRRDFLKWIGAGILGTTLVTILDPFTMLQRLWQPANSSSDLANSIQFPEYYTVTGTYPQMDLSHYRLTVDGKVQSQLLLSYHQLSSLTQEQEVVNFQCVTGWSVPNVRWKGIHIKTLLQLAKAHETVKYIHFYSFDGVYTECLSLDEALSHEVILATHLNNQPLLREAGFPLRLIVPTMYGYKSIKWLSRISFSDVPITGYWEQRGYPTQAFLT
ncbi:MAG: molybdopterin-dependent oxidoreductase [Acidibacillus sp.]|uniref:Sulfoxide reductase catalytic subunit YedY n=1 Tax=Sulfoacidibacillus ferrooxidans TaxID=2005001 RepID=A0A9X1V9A5_9BACL|nr:molybdopterin-dependent oxidoreductase [Sulfoacidibacillus ferrooxidans]MCI0183966.1 Sulfoxide reductase catalytic subunit YedY [Sulfoacidibacillus ferrooxidans]MCY0894452.1 molybdopterin-dependent oxidoreductase [Acidibacillus sp.]